MTKQASRHVDAVSAALDILNCFLKYPELRVKDIIDLTGMTRNRIMRIAGTLVHAEYLIFNAIPGKYTLGPKFFFLGKMFERSLDVLSMARPILKSLAKNTEESASFYIQSGMKRIVLARVEGFHAIRYSVKEGQSMPLYAGAAGKVLLAFGSDDTRRKIFSKSSLPQLTNKTITDKKHLAKELDAIKKNGYALSHSERIAGATSVAAPVFDYHGNLSGAICIAGPTQRFDNDSIDDKIEKVISAAENLTHKIGGDKWLPSR
jgi:DNA-binding IclR family transcriptional regulator